MNKRSVFDLVNVTVKITNILPPIVDAFGQNLSITKALAFDNTLSIRINFYYDLAEVPQNNETYNITYLQVQNYNTEKFLKTTECTITKINKPDDFVNTESNIDNTKVISVVQKSLSKTFYCSDCNEEVTPDHEDLVDVFVG